MPTDTHSLGNKLLVMTGLILLYTYAIQMFGGVAR